MRWFGITQTYHTNSKIWGSGSKPPETLEFFLTFLSKTRCKIYDFLLTFTAIFFFFLLSSLALPLCNTVIGKGLCPFPFYNTSKNSRGLKPRNQSILATPLLLTNFCLFSKIARLCDQDVDEKLVFEYCYRVFGKKKKVSQRSSTSDLNAIKLPKIGFVNDEKTTVNSSSSTSCAISFTTGNGSTL